jgi:hypothetical protein
MAIQSVCTVLEPYDSDKLFPVYGFGFKFQDHPQVFYDYPLTGDFQRPQVQGVAGIQDVYARFIRNPALLLYGPTNFSPLINTVNRMVAAELQQCVDPAGGFSAGLPRYHILLIITDGLITDMAATIDAIVAASFLPISIIIVGVGNEDFANMEFLDADGTLLVSRSGQTAERDCVQFVAMNKFHGSSIGTDLPQHVLAEVPRQFLEFTKKRHIAPIKLHHS